MRSAPDPAPESARTVTALGVDGEVSCAKADAVAVEEPLAVRLTFGPLRDRQRATLSVTMRTPGHDRELAAGMLFTEGVLTEPGQILTVEAAQAESAVRVDLHPDVTVELARLERSTYTGSACGVCGKTSVEAIEVAMRGPLASGPRIPAGVVHALPARLRKAQPTFAHTGGLHAAALFDAAGNLLAVREDVGRHNAVDKLIGAEFLAGRLPLADRVLFVSGRAGFELIQKAAVAGAPVFAAVGAPTSLAVELAQRVGMTLLGFVRDGRFNVYCGTERIAV